MHLCTERCCVALTRSQLNQQHSRFEHIVFCLVPQYCGLSCQVEWYSLSLGPHQAPHQLVTILLCILIIIMQISKLYRISWNLSFVLNFGCSALPLLIRHNQFIHIQAFPHCTAAICNNRINSITTISVISSPA